MDENHSPLKLTLKELVDHYEGFLRECERKSAETRGTYQRALRDFLKWFPIDKRFLFRVRDVERYRRYLVERKGLKNVSVATYISALRRFCQYLIDIKVLAGNPATSVVGGRRPTRHSRTFLSYDEIGALLGAVERGSLQGTRDYAIILMMLDCALSERECILADVADLYPTPGGMALRVQGKGRAVKDLTAELSPDAQAALEDYLARRFGAEERLPDAPLFASLSNRTHGARMTARGVREAVSRWLRQSGVKGNRDRELTPFSLRHTAGLIMVDNGASLEEVMRRMRIEWRPTAQLYFKIRGKSGTPTEPETPTNESEP